MVKALANMSFFLTGVSGNFSQQSSEASSRSRVPFLCGGQRTPGWGLVSTYEYCEVFWGPVNASLRLISPRKYSFLFFYWQNHTLRLSYMSPYQPSKEGEKKKVCAGGGDGRKARSISHLETCRPVAKDGRICHPVCSRKNSHK